MQRYFIENDKELNLNSEQLHHVTKVMRMKEGDLIETVFQHELYICKITSLSPFEIEVIQKEENSPELNVDITLFYCLPKGDKLDLVIQKATEIGVKRIILVQSSRCVCKYKKEDYEKKLQRFQKIALEASEQSHRLFVPRIEEIISFNEIKNYYFDYAYIAYENEKEDSLRIDLKKMKKGDHIAVIVGSEGGFSLEEVEYAKKCNYKPISLGKRILRSETACIFLLSVLSYELEEV